MHDTITIDRSTVQQALLVLEDWWGSFPDFRSLHDKVAIAALRTALEQQTEPVACKTLCELCVKRGYDFCANVAKTTPIIISPTPPQQQAEPVGSLSVRYYRGCKSMTNTDFDYTGDLPEGDYELYTAPPQRKELSAGEILNMMPSTIPAEYDGELMEFARAVEAKTKEGT